MPRNERVIIAYDDEESRYEVAKHLREIKERLVSDIDFSIRQVLNQENSIMPILFGVQRDLHEAATLDGLIEEAVRTIEKLEQVMRENASAHTSEAVGKPVGEAVFA
jgi:hypothetical protein